MLGSTNNNSQTAEELHVMLSSALSKERKTWKPALAKMENKGSIISPILREEMVRWLLRLTAKFHFSPETFTLSVTILDHFLSLVKAHPKYLECITFSCFFLAAKLKEEDEMVPATQDMIHESECGCSVAEILRMERVILDKLKWDINFVNGLDFLQICHALLMTLHPWLLDDVAYMTPSRHLSLLTCQISHLMISDKLTAFKGSTIAVSMLSLELEVLSHDWLAIAYGLQQMIGIKSAELIRCREFISSTLYGLSHHTKKESANKATAITTLSNSPPDTPTINPKTAKRNIWLEDIEDFLYSMKRLYIEEEIPGSNLSCGSESLRGEKGDVQPQNALTSIEVS